MTHNIEQLFIFFPIGQSTELLLQNETTPAEQAQSPQLCSQMRGTASAPRLETMQQNEWKQGRKTLNTQANPTTFILITVLIPYKYHLFLPTKVNHTCGKLELLERSSLLLYHIQLTHFKGRRNTFAKQLRFVRGQCPLPKPSHSKQRSGVKAVQSGAAPWCGLGHIYKLQPCLISSKEHMELWILMLDLRYMKSFSRAGTGAR